MVKVKGRSLLNYWEKSYTPAAGMCGTTKLYNLISTLDALAADGEEVVIHKAFAEILVRCDHDSDEVYGFGTQIVLIVSDADQSDTAQTTTWSSVNDIIDGVTTGDLSVMWLTTPKLSKVGSRYFHAGEAESKLNLVTSIRVDFTEAFRRLSQKFTEPGDDDLYAYLTAIIVGGAPTVTMEIDVMVSVEYSLKSRELLKGGKH